MAPVCPQRRVIREPAEEALGRTCCLGPLRVGSWWLRIAWPAPPLGRESFAAFSASLTRPGPPETQPRQCPCQPGQPLGLHPKRLLWHLPGGLIRCHRRRPSVLSVQGRAPGSSPASASCPCLWGAGSATLAGASGHPLSEHVRLSSGPDL